MKVWHHHFCTPLPLVFEEEHRRLKELLEEIRVDAITKVIGIPTSEFKQDEQRPDFCKFISSFHHFIAYYQLPFDILQRVMNPLLRTECASSQMILMKLPVPEEDMNKAGEYMTSLRALVENLPPTLLMNCSTHLPVITRCI